MQKISQQVFEEFLKLLCDYIAMRDYDHCTTLCSDDVIKKRGHCVEPALLSNEK